MLCRRKFATFLLIALVVMAIEMEFTREKPPIGLLEYRVRTHERYLPSVRIATGVSIQGAILSSGDIIHQGSNITNSVLGYRVVIEEGCILDHCVLLGADRNEFHNDQIRRKYTTHIGKSSRLSYVISDKNVWIGEGVNIDPHNATPERRKEILQGIGLKPYRELGDGRIEGDFYIEPETGILVIGKQHDADPKEPILPNGLKC